MKKTIGLLGGVSFPSTALYYETLNLLYNQKYGGFHCCPMILYNIDYHEIKSQYGKENAWEEIPAMFKEELQTLADLKPSCMMIANNTLHKAFDLIKDEIEIDVPVIHIIDITVEHILKNNYKNVLLLATRFTMEDDYFKKPLRENGIEVTIPDEQERAEIQKIQTQLSLGKLEQAHIEYFEMLNEKYKHLDAFVLACTEIPLVYKHIKTDVKVIDNLQLQCEKALEIFD